MNVSLKKGDTIGIVAPSAPISAFCPRRTERGINALKKLGFKVKTGMTIKKVHNFTAGTVGERVDDIHAMFVDTKVKAIMATIGGFNTNDLLDKLDYKLIKDNNKKLFIGYSDMTVLLCSLYEKSNVPTIMGPMLLPQFGEYPGILDFTKESFLQVVANLGTKQHYKLPWSSEMTEEMLWWDKQDNRKRKIKKNSGWQIIQKGKAEGHLMAANLNTLLKLAGTKYFPKLRGSVLFLEDDSDESAATIMRMLVQLRHMGVFKEIKGLVFGRFQEKSEIGMTLFNEMIDDALDGIKLPVVANVDFGHTDPMLSLPIGKMVSVNTDDYEIRIVL